MKKKTYEASEQWTNPVTGQKKWAQMRTTITEEQEETLALAGMDVGKIASMKLLGMLKNAEQDETAESLKRAAKARGGSTIAFDPFENETDAEHSRRISEFFEKFMERRSSERGASRFGIIASPGAAWVLQTLLDFPKTSGEDHSDPVYPTYAKYELKFEDENGGNERTAELTLREKASEKFDDNFAVIYDENKPSDCEYFEFSGNCAPRIKTEEERK